LENTRVTTAMLGSIQHPAFIIQPESSDAHVGPEPALSNRREGGSQVGTLNRQAARGAAEAWSDISSAAGQAIAQLLKRPEIIIEHLVPVLRDLAPTLFDRQAPASTEHMPREGALPSAIRNELKSVETEIKYEGYLQQQHRAIERLKKAEQ